MSVGREIKKARIDKRMRQKDVVQATGLGVNRISAIESDMADPPFSVMQTLARVLGFSLDSLPPVERPSRISQRRAGPAPARAQRAVAGKG
jgi:transcriptional regulator with XRE-family HTH domain